MNESKENNKLMNSISKEDYNREIRNAYDTYDGPLYLPHVRSRSTVIVVMDEKIKELSDKCEEYKRLYEDEQEAHGNEVEYGNDLREEVGRLEDLIRQSKVVVDDGTYTRHVDYNHIVTHKKVDSEKAERQVDYPCCAEMKKDITHLLGQINDLSKRIDFHAVNNSTICEPDEISLCQLIGVVDQRCARIEQSLGGMTEEATFEKIDRLEAVAYYGLFSGPDLRIEPLEGETFSDADESAESLLKEDGDRDTCIWILDGAALESLSNSIDKMNANLREG